MGLACHVISSLSSIHHLSSIIHLPQPEITEGNSQNRRPHRKTGNEKKQEERRGDGRKQLTSPIIPSFAQRAPDLLRRAADGSISVEHGAYRAFFVEYWSACWGLFFVMLVGVDTGNGEVWKWLDWVGLGALWRSGGRNGWVVAVCDIEGRGEGRGDIQLDATPRECHPYHS